MHGWERMSKQDNLSSVYLSIYSGLTRAVARIVPPKEIEDIVQETYVKVCQVKNKDEITHPRSFLYRTARNLAFDYLKRAETQRADGVGDDSGLFDGDTDAFSDDIFEQVAKNEEFAQFCEAVRLLPVQCRKVFVLKKVYGYSQQEIARELDLSESTVEKHVAAGIKRCTYFMMSQGEQGDIPDFMKSSSDSKRAASSVLPVSKSGGLS